MTNIIQTVTQSINQNNIITNSISTSIHNSQIILNNLTHNRSRIIHSLIRIHSSNSFINSKHVIQSQIISPSTCFSYININCNKQRSGTSNISYNPFKLLTINSKINQISTRKDMAISILQTIRQRINQCQILPNSYTASINNSQIIFNNFTDNRSWIINSLVNLKRRNFD